MDRMRSKINLTRFTRDVKAPCLSSAFFARPRMIRCHLSALMGERKVKIADVFRATKISRSTLSAIYYERAKGIDYQTMDKLCRYLKVSVGELLSMEDDVT